MASPYGLTHRPNSKPDSTPEASAASSSGAASSYADMAKKGPKQADEDVSHTQHSHQDSMLMCPAEYVVEMCLNHHNM